MKRLYSVWNPNHVGFDYYEADADLREGVIANTPNLPSAGRLGLTPEEASAQLPPGARPAGQGSSPKGIIATRKGGYPAMGDLLGLDSDTVIKGALLVGVGWLIWTKLLSPTQRRRATVYAYRGAKKRRK